MSYNNNFSYFNVPNASNDWWGSKDAKKPPSFEENRVVKIGERKPSDQWLNELHSNSDYNNQPYAQNYMPNYAQSMILPSENRPIEPVHPRHEVLQGTVTQLFSSFGYINDNIIFSKSDVSGPMVKVGDRVAVDATYQPNNPTKYKGERVCKIDDTRFTSSTTAPSSGSGNSTGLSKMKPLSRDISSRIDIPLTYRPESGKFDSKLDGKKSEMKSDKKYVKKSDSSRRSSVPKETKMLESKRYAKFSERAKSPIDMTRKSSYKKSAKMSLKRKSRSSSKNQKPALKESVEPEKSTSKVIVDKLPKQIESFALRELDCAMLKFRCKNLHPPNQFFHASLKFQQTFPLNHPMKLGNSCHFKVLDKKVKSIDNYINHQLDRDIDPEDADTTFSAKVMLLSTDELAEFYKQTLPLAEEFEGVSKMPITKAIKFLVGSLGPNKEFAFGGAWSPSLDGPDPDTNPRVLINTAIRTCKNLTGIDLSGCSSWPKFLELHYYRPLQKLRKKIPDQENKVDGKTEVEPEERFEYIEPRMETVVYFVPDIWNCVPSQESWNEVKRMYQEQLTSLMCPPPSLPLQIKSIPTTNNTNQDGNQITKKAPSDNQEEEDYNFNENEEVEEKPKDLEEVSVSNEQATHFSLLNVDGMKIVEIKKELELRKLTVKGVMDQLKARLKSALEKEESEEKEKVKDSLAVVKPVVEVKQAGETTLSDTDKNELKMLYNLPDTPHVLVHHNLKFQDSKMKIKTMSLHSLLSYYDTKLEENTFEVALFGKQFLEMLRRDAVFNIYKSLVVTPEMDLVTKEENDAKKPKLMVTTSKRTVNRPLLFSCVILDRERSNKIGLDELKLMIEGLGICLSSDQLSALLNKIKDPSKCLHYRLLTDKEIDDNDITKLLSTDQTDDLDYIRELAMGNKALFEEDVLSMDTSVDFEEIDRLKNELDKSERCRQTLELRFAEIREESEKSKTQIQTQTNEIQKLRDQIIEYRTKYHNEQDRGDFYKRDFDKIYRDLKNFDKLAVGISKAITESIDHYKKSDKPSSKPASIDHTKTKVEGKAKLREESKAPNTSGKSTMEDVSETSDMPKDISSNGLEAATKNSDASGADVEMEAEETSDTNQVNCRQSARDDDDDVNDHEDDDEDATGHAGTDHHNTASDSNHGHEDFELSKPSDYEIIILDETE